MTETAVHYDNMADRKVKVSANETLKLRMLSDTFDTDWRPGDEPHGTMIFTDVMPPPVITEPPRSSHISVLTAIDAAKARPARIKRVWEGRVYFYDCLVTQAVKDEFVAGKIAIGNYVLVHFDDVDEQIVTAKVWKSW